MCPGPPRDRERPVGHVPDQRVREAVLGVPREARDGLRSQEALRLERGEDVREIRTPERAGERLRPEAPSHHGRLLQRSLLEGRERVDPGGEDREHRVRQRRGRRVGARDPAIGLANDDAFVDQPSDHLLEEQRVALGLLGHAGTQVSGQLRALEESCDEVLALFVGQRLEPEPRGASHAVGERRAATRRTPDGPSRRSARARASGSRSAARSRGVGRPPSEGPRTGGSSVRARRARPRSEARRGRSGRRPPRAPGSPGDRRRAGARRWRRGRRR